MKTAAVCPELALYKKLVCGQLLSPDKEAVLDHLEGCNACVQQVESLSEKDTLVDLIRQARTLGERPTGETIARLVERLRDMRPSAEEVPKAPAQIRLACSGCGKNLKVKIDLAGKKGKCPHCQAIIRVPNTVQPPGEESPRSPASGIGEPLTLAPAIPVGGRSSPATTSDHGAGQSPPANKDYYAFLAPAQSPDELGRLGPYRILRVLGAGGMGVVFQAEDPHLQRLVALKAMLPGLATSDSAKERFLREARAAAGLKHDHVVTIHQVGEDRGVPFLAMEFLEGEPLDEHLKRESKLPLVDLLRIGREMAEGLAAAHERGLIHRDIKPANVWLEGKKGRVKILDFGLARAFTGEAHLTQSGAIVGTPAYMAPEQAQNKNVGPPCDLFSLGCVLYRMATGGPPFGGTDIISTLMAVATETPKPPVSINFALPTELSDFILQLLAKNPEERPASAQAVAEALQGMERQIGQASVRPAPAQGASRELSNIDVQGLKSPRKKGDDADGVKSVHMQAGRSGKKRPPLPVLVGMTGGLLAAVIAGIVLFWPTPNGTIRIESDDPLVEIVFDRTGSTIKGADKEPITLRAGDHAILVKRGDLEFETDKILLKKGKTLVLKIELLPGKIQVAADGNVIGVAKLPAVAVAVPSRPAERPDSTSPGPSSDNWLVLDGFDGPGKGKHIVLVSGDEEYRSEEALPQLAKILAKHHGFKCTVVFAIDPKDGTIQPDQPSNIPGLEALKTADLMILFTRFRDLPDAQMKYIADYLDSGKPVIGLRTATHAFKIPPGKTFSKYSYQSQEWEGGFGRQVLGQTWTGHQGITGEESTRGILVKGQENHPILRGIKDGGIWALTNVYSVTLPLPGDSKPLVLGQVLQGMQPTDKPVPGAKNDPMMPVAWVKTFPSVSGKRARVFTTTIGASQDLLNEGIRRLVVNAAYWAVGLEDKITDKANVDIVGEFKPLPFKLGGFEKGRRPSDHAIFADGNGFVPLFNGKDLTGWKTHPDKPGDWRVEQGILVGRGPKQNCLFSERGDYEDFQFRIEAMINKGGNSGQLFRKPFGTAIILDGYEAQIDSSAHLGQLTGSLFVKDGRATVPIREVLAPVDTWFTQEVIAKGNHIIVLVNGKKVVDFIDKDDSWCKGHLAFQLQEPETVVRFRRIEVKELKRPKGAEKPPTKTEPALSSDEAWLKSVAAMRPAQQVAAVAAKLKELNPGFDGTVGPTYKDGAVIGLEFLTDNVTDIWPVRALTGMTVLNCRGAIHGKLADLSPLKGMPLTNLNCSITQVSDLSPLKDMKLTSLAFYGAPVSDLSPLKGMPLTYLNCGWTPVSDLSPLKGMKLTSLRCEITRVSDLAPLKGMPLTDLRCFRMGVSDLSPLKGMPLTALQCWATPVSDLSPLTGMKLTFLNCARTPVSDLSPLKGMPLKGLTCYFTQVTDLTPLKEVPLRNLHCDFKPERDAAILRSIKTLENINEKPAAEFWKGVAASIPKRAEGPTKVIINSLGMRFMPIPAGKFTMGSPKEEIDRCLKLDTNQWGKDHHLSEGPSHEVEITRPFYMGSTEVTVGQFRQFVNEKKYQMSDDRWQKPGFTQTDDHPVVTVSWYNAVDFCTWLSAKEGKQYRLPTEAEWEYSCRAGKAGTRYCFGDDDEQLENYAWYNRNARGGTHPVAKLKPNAWGLYDMHGNAWEYCQDNYDPNYYKNSPRKDPLGSADASGGSVVRGGGWEDNPLSCRSACHFRHDKEDRRRPAFGFRVVLVATPPGGEGPR